MADQVAQIRSFDESSPVIGQSIAHSGIMIFPDHRAPLQLSLNHLKAKHLQVGIPPPPRSLRYILHAISYEHERYILYLHPSFLLEHRSTHTLTRLRNVLLKFESTVSLFMSVVVHLVKSGCDFQRIGRRVA